MKRPIIFLLLIVLFLQLIQAGGVGITPVHFKEFFEPGLTKTYTFNAFAANADEGVNLYIKGDLAEYVSLSTDYLPNGGEFVVTISLPGKIEIPGTHKIYVGATEARKNEAGNIGGIAAIQGRIDILVPYPGQYIESSFKISDINKGEKALSEIEIQNLGTESVTIRPRVDIYSSEIPEALIAKIISERTMESKESLTITEDIDTEDLSPGEYIAYATIDWGKIMILNQSLRVGQFLVEILDYDYQFEKGKINPFTIKVQNKWNKKIDQVFIEVGITDEGVPVGNFKTVSVSTDPWEVKNITGYFDTTGLESKRYIAKIDLSYDGAKTTKLVAIYVNDPPMKTYRNYIIAAIVVGLLIIAAFIYLIWKVRKLEHGKSKNENKK